MCENVLLKTGTTTSVVSLSSHLIPMAYRQTYHSTFQNIRTHIMNSTGWLSLLIELPTMDDDTPHFRTRKQQVLHPAGIEKMGQYEPFLTIAIVINHKVILIPGVKFAID